MTPTFLIYQNCCKAPVQLRRYPIVDYLITALNIYETDVPNRTAITDWVEAYNEKQSELEATQDRVKARSLRKALDAKADEVRDAFPELAFGHACFMADYFSSTDPDLAARYYQAAVDYYQNRMPLRIRELSIGSFLTEPPANTKRLQYKELAEDYSGAHLFFVASYFRQMALESLNADTFQKDVD